MWALKARIGQFRLHTTAHVPGSLLYSSEEPLSWHLRIHTGRAQPPSQRYSLYCDTIGALLVAARHVAAIACTGNSRAPAALWSFIQFQRGSPRLGGCLYRRAFRNTVLIWSRSTSAVVLAYRTSRGTLWSKFSYFGAPNTVLPRCAVPNRLPTTPVVSA